MLRRLQTRSFAAARDLLPAGTRTQLFVDGEFKDGSAGRSFAVHYPATGEELLQCSRAEIADADAAVRGARKAFPGWKRTAPSKRAAMLDAMAAELKRDLSQWATLETLDNGKPIKEAEGDMEACIGLFEYYAKLARELEQHPRERVNTDDADVEAWLVKEPVGAVGLLTPWNYPLMQSVVKVAAALAAGCTMVLKPSSVCPLTSLKLGDLANNAGVPPGVLQVLPGMGSDVGTAIAGDRRLAKVSFTGSGQVGQLVAEAAAKSLRPCGLELGGKGPIVVFDDCDVDATVDWIMCGIFMCTGQICSATSRLIVHEKVADQLLEKLVARTKKLVVGDPLSRETEMGPLVSTAALRDVSKALELCRKEPGLLTGGSPMDRPGYFVEPTIVRDPALDSFLWKEEVFGPLLVVRSFATEAEALELANDTNYGLGAAVVTADAARGERMAAEMESGIIFVNCSNLIPTSVPFGGIKDSGFGREWGEEGLHDYMHTKSVVRVQPSYSWNWYTR